MYGSSQSVYSSPVCADLDSDGDVDCLVGLNNGSRSRIVYFENRGTPTAANWSDRGAIGWRYGGDYEVDDTDLKFPRPTLVDYDYDGEESVTCVLLGIMSHGNFCFMRRATGDIDLIVGIKRNSKEPGSVWLLEYVLQHSSALR